MVGIAQRLSLLVLEVIKPLRDLHHHSILGQALQTQPGEIAARGHQFLIVPLDQRLQRLIILPLICLVHRVRVVKAVVQGIAAGLAL